MIPTGLSIPTTQRYKNRELSDEDKMDGGSNHLTFGTFEGMENSHARMLEV